MQKKHICFIFNPFHQSLSLILLLSSSLLLAKESHADKNPYSDTSWVKLTLIYYHDIFCSEECRKYIIDGCSKITGQLNKLMCREEVQLIRPEILAETWNKRQYQQGYIDLTIKESGIEHVKAHIISIIPFIPKSPRKGSGDVSAQWVTGLFKRHVLNVVYYTFKNINTGEISGIHATPDHEFYLKNRRTFLPVREITEKDILITGKGDNVKLVKSNVNTGMTGDNKVNIPVLTYNLEIWKKHTYFVGSYGILVHNTCQCGKCKMIFHSPGDVRNHSCLSKDCSPVSYLCGIGRCTEERERIHYINRHQFDDHGVHNMGSCSNCGDQSSDWDSYIEHMLFKCKRIKKQGRAVSQAAPGHFVGYHPYVKAKTVMKEKSREVEQISQSLAEHLSAIINDFDKSLKALYREELEKFEEACQDVLEESKKFNFRVSKTSL